MEPPQLIENKCTYSYPFNFTASYSGSFRKLFAVDTILRALSADHARRASTAYPPMARLIGVFKELKCGRNLGAARRETRLPPPHNAFLQDGKRGAKGRGTQGLVIRVWSAKFFATETTEPLRIWVSHPYSSFGKGWVYECCGERCHLL